MIEFTPDDVSDADVRAYCRGAAEHLVATNPADPPLAATYYRLAADPGLADEMVRSGYYIEPADLDRLAALVRAGLVAFLAHLRNGPGPEVPR